MGRIEVVEFAKMPVLLSDATGMDVPTDGACVPSSDESEVVAVAIAEVVLVTKTVLLV